MTDQPNGVLIGAYERDNFGDILFLTQTRKYLTVPTIAAAPFSADTTSYDGDKISAYPETFATSDVRFIWTVGGEAGSTSMAQADAMATGAHAAAARGVHVPEFASPYMPRPSRYASTRHRPSVVNSVGVSGAERLTGRHRIETWAALREASFLSVRDRASSRFLTRQDIDHVVAPDLVHSMRLTNPVAPGDGNIALVQSKVKYIDGIGVDAFARMLVSASSLKPFHLRLFSAGEAAGHDSTSRLHDVAERINVISGTVRADVSTSITASEKATEIARAGMWIGTSLHGLILSTAYGVPRVGLLLEKLEKYRSTWDIPYPAQVSYTDLDRAVEAALEMHRPSDADRLADRLAVAAEANMLRAVEAAVDTTRVERSESKVEAELRRMTPRREATENAVKSGRALLGKVRRRIRG
ncbi:polysaccharide pyruvyl transferase family protein [Microbacterium sp. NPDC055683]